MIRFGAIVVTALVLLAPAAPAASSRGLNKAPFEVVRTGVVTGTALREISGMATSRRDANLLWVHNDSGSRAYLYALSPDGRQRARVTLKGATARDWEDMASFDLDGTPMLVVADVGDNNATRSNLWLHFLIEPVIDASVEDQKLEAEVAWSVPFRFHGGAADCEAIAVDAAAGEVLLLTKRENPPQLHVLPLKPGGAKPLSGSRIDTVELAAVENIPRPRAEDLMADPMFGAFSSQPTAMDLSDNELLILTYRHAYLYEREANESWADAVARPPQIILLPRMRQSESVTFGRDGRDAYVTSEKTKAPIYRLTRQPDRGDTSK